jgi:hypothetical protein
MSDNGLQIAVLMRFLGWARLEAAWLSQMVSDVCCPIAARDRPANEFAATTRPSRHLNLRLHPHKLRSVWLLTSLSARDRVVKACARLV